MPSGPGPRGAPGLQEYAPPADAAVVPAAAAAAWELCCRGCCAEYGLCHDLLPLVGVAVLVLDARLLREGNLCCNTVRLRCWQQLHTLRQPQCVAPAGQHARTHWLDITHNKAHAVDVQLLAPTHHTLLHTQLNQMSTCRPSLQPLTLQQAVHPPSSFAAWQPAASC